MKKIKQVLALTNDHCTNSAVFLYVDALRLLRVANSLKEVRTLTNAAAAAAECATSLRFTSR